MGTTLTNRVNRSATVGLGVREDQGAVLLNAEGRHTSTFARICVVRAVIVGHQEHLAVRRHPGEDRRRAPSPAWEANYRATTIKAHWDNDILVSQNHPEALRLSFHLTCSQPGWHAKDSN
eukprot:CAMPEP_0170611600 /NCGR_PEP_ID=MMETSP0224-20130122/23272_1 /TAXON_ID=285029 /ORGANISM="Togula jolla, Strain CCCM 725" /LENGTH=119 /DNA_ID=CAMNT_0010937039 /DNA_START=687 /DNA_END=1046 /DNA_ORIENTATION=-